MSWRLESGSRGPMPGSKQGSRSQVCLPWCRLQGCPRSTPANSESKQSKHLSNQRPNTALPFRYEICSEIRDSLIWDSLIVRTIWIHLVHKNDRARNAADEKNADNWQEYCQLCSENSWSEWFCVTYHCVCVWLCLTYHGPHSHSPLPSWGLGWSFSWARSGKKLHKYPCHEFME